MFLVFLLQGSGAPIAQTPGAVTITALGVPITQNFDTLPASGTATWVNDSTILGWYHARTGNGTTIVANNGGSNAGNLYSYGTGTATERALGSIGSGNAAAGNFHWGVRLANGSAALITSLTVSYTGEQWRNGGNASAQTADFSYRVGAGLGNALTDFTTGGTGVPELSFTSPVTGTTASALDGNATANKVAISHTITGLNLAPGDEILLRWADVDHGGADHGLSIDDLTITAGGVVIGQPTLSINDVSVAEGDSGTSIATFTVTVSPDTHPGVTFDITTADGAGASAATAASGDYEARAEAGVPIPAGQTTYSFDVVINGDTTFEPSETFFVNLSNATGAVIADNQGVGTITNDDPVVSAVVISQVYGGGSNQGATLARDFIELFNRSASPVTVDGWSVQYTSPAGTGTWQVTALTGTIAAGGYYLVHEGPASPAPGTTPLPAADASGTILMGATAGKVALQMSTTAISGSCPASDNADLVGYGGANCFEGPGPAGDTSNTTAALRKRAGCFDSNNNRFDFSIGAPFPRNSASPANDCTPLTAAIHDIQGNGLASPLAGEDVITSGVVTGVKSNGFFLQTVDGSADADPATSEGIFVFTSSAPAVVAGNAVTARGIVSEFFTLTQIEATLPGDVVVTSPDAGLPAPTPLMPAMLDPAGSIDQLERFEGMRMHAASLTSVAPTNEFGEIATVLTGVPRPMREPGISILDPVPPDPTTGTVDCCIPRFDENPERLFLDTEGLAGSSVLTVTSNVILTNVTGPLDFTFGAYKLLPETLPVATANMSGVPVPTPAAGEFTVGGFNIENFAGNETRRRKAALAIRQLMKSPDVIGHIEILDQPTLQSLADQVNADATAAGEPDPGYAALLIPAPAGGTQNVGFLVKTSRLQIDALSQELATETFINPNTGNPETLHDRPPLVLRATVDPFGDSPRPVIVVVNHLRSFIDIELVGGEGPRVRAKRKAQAESVAGLLQQLQTDNPGIPVVSIGDYNAYQFNDGYTDPIATLKGAPTADDEMVVDASPDVVSPNYANLTDTLPAAERYSFVFEGTPQALDHVLVNTVAASYVQRYAIARGNADFPDVPGTAFANDPTRPERASDHDMPVAFFRFPDPPTVSIGDVTIAEGDSGTSVATFTVTLSAPAFREVSAAFATSDGSARAGSDYLAATGEVHFAPQDVSETISVTITGDTLREPSETFTVTLSAPSGASIGDGSAVGTITNDDPGPTIDSFAPAAGHAGQIVDIRGTGFTGVTRVAFNGEPTLFLRVSSTQILAMVPLDATTGPITVTTSAGTGVSSDSFQVLPVPTEVLTVAPNRGRVGQSVLILGQGFSGATSVRFGSVEATFDVLLPNLIRATVPIGAVTAPVSVQAPGGTATSPSAFVVVGR